MSLFRHVSMSGWINDSIRLLNYLMKGHFCLKRADIGVWQVLVFYNLRSLEYKKVSISIFNLFSPSLYTFCTFHNTKKKYDIETRLDDRAILQQRYLQQQKDQNLQLWNLEKLMIFDGFTIEGFILCRVYRFWWFRDSVMNIGGDPLDYNKS